MLKTKLFLFLFISAVIVSGAFAQDHPTSTGPAPYVERYEPTSEVFVNLLHPNSRSLVYINSGLTAGQLNKTANMTSCALTTLGPPISYFPGAMTRVSANRYFTIHQLSPYQLYAVDTLGNQTLKFNVTGVPGTLNSVTGMTWSQGQLIALFTSCSQSQIGTIDTTTGAVTLIGSPTTSPACGIQINANPAGTLFVVDIASDNLYRVNRTTGVFTLVGPLGVNANYGQDGHFDADGTYFWAAYVTQPELRRIDTTTGASALVCGPYTGTQATAIGIIPFAPPPPPAPIQTTLCRNLINKPIPDNTIIYDTITMIGNTGCTITDVNIRIDTVIHTGDSDLIFRVNHAGTEVRIINRVGGGGDNFIGTIINDSGSCRIGSTGCNTAPFTGTFGPSVGDSLVRFNGLTPQGTWILSIRDTATADTGMLMAWCVVVSYSCPTGGVQQTEIPNYYSLSQNYPNPFNPTTTIKFGLPKAGNVKLVVFDILGREVARLVNNEFRDVGTYTVTFDASSLSSGVYFYRLEAGEFTQTKKMLLVK